MRKVLLVTMAIWGALMLSCSPENMPEGKTVTPDPVIVTPSITADKTTLPFNNTSSTETVTITANVEWVAECSDTWVTVTKGSSSQLNVSVMTNQGEARTSTITLKQQGQSTAMATISVSQVAADVEISVNPSSLSFESGATSKMVIVTSNVEWVAECSDAWVTVSKSSSTQLSISVSANRGESRTSTVTLNQQGKSTAIATISLSQEAAPAISVNSSSLSFESGSSSKIVTVNSNVEWVAECSDAWVTVSKNSPTQLNVSIIANQGDARTSIIILKQQGKSTALATVTVSQKAAPAISASPSSLSFESVASNKIVTVTSNVEWSYDCSDSWVTVKKDSPSQLTVSVSTNTSSARSSKIYLREQGKSTTLATISVNQEKTISSVSGNTYTVKGVSFKMIPVEGGTFMMGATAEQGSDAISSEKPVHSVTLSSYSIGETEVTQELWEAVMGSNPSFFIGLKHPVENVSWIVCQEFIQKLNALFPGKNFRLPTEAEWEYAARGGKKSRGYKYAGSNIVDNVAWYTVNSLDKGFFSPFYGPQNVGGMAPNELGLYDMSGNVQEWCYDGLSSYTSGAQTNPTGKTSSEFRMYRGGSWGNDAWYCRVSQRSEETRVYSSGYLGLRLAL